MVQTFFLIAALNTGLDVLSADIQNTYLIVPLAAKYCTIVRASNGFPKELDGGRSCIIIRTLYYGLHIDGTSFQAFLTKHLRQLGYTPC